MRMKDEKHAMQNRLTKRGGGAVFHFAFFIACFSFCIRPVFAQDWTLSTADFRTEAVSLRAIDDKGVHVTWQGRQRLIPPDEFVQVDRNVTTAVERTPKFMLTLAGGDHVGGDPVKIADDRLTWRNA